MSENWYVVHTQPRGEKMLKAILDGDASVSDTYVPLRQRFTIEGGRRVSRLSLTMPGLVFARADKQQLIAVLRDKSINSRLMLDSSRMGHEPMVVRDDEMTAFRLFNDNTAGQLTLLRSPYSHFQASDRVRIMSGPFAGYEGHIREIGHDNKLIFKVGSMAIAVSNIMRYDVAVVENCHPETDASLQLRLADRLLGRLEDAGVVDDAPARLRSVISQLGRDRRDADFPEAFSAEDRADAITLARWFSADPQQLLRTVPDAPLRRFLTPASTEGFVRHADSLEQRIAVSLQGADYTAHVATRPDGTSFCFWADFAVAVAQLKPTERQMLIEKLRRYGLSTFADAVAGTDTLRFEGSLLCGCTDASELARLACRIVEEILGSVRARRWRSLLYSVWVR